MHVCQYDKVKPSSKFVVVVVNWQQSLTVLKVGLPFIFIYFKCRLAAPRPYFGHCQRDSLFKRMLITSIYSAFDSKVASSLAKLNPVLSGVWIGTTFRFLSNVFFLLPELFLPSYFNPLDILLSESKIDGSFPDSQFHLWLSIGRLDMTEIYFEEAYACMPKKYIRTKMAVKLNF